MFSFYLKPYSASNDTICIRQVDVIVLKGQKSVILRCCIRLLKGGFSRRMPLWPLIGKVRSIIDAGKNIPRNNVDHTFPKMLSASHCKRIPVYKCSCARIQKRYIGSPKNICFFQDYWFCTSSCNWSVGPYELFKSHTLTCIVCLTFI